MTTALFIMNLLAIIAALISLAASRAYTESQKEIRRADGELADTQIQLRDATHMGITSTKCADCKHETDTCKKLDCHGGLQVCVNDEEGKL